MFVGVDLGNDKKCEFYQLSGSKVEVIEKSTQISLTFLKQWLNKQTFN